MVPLGRLLAFLYRSQYRRFLGLTIRGWLGWIPFWLFVAGVVLRWPIWLWLLFLLLFIAVRVAYMLAARMGYQRFVLDEGYRLPDTAEAQPVNQKIPLRATGIFSLNDREDYVLQHPGEYWRVPLGQHIFMIQHRAGRFLYQVIKPEYVVEVQPGFLLFGAEPHRALALTFLVTWGPQYAEYKLYYVGADNARPPEQKRTVYLTFENEAALHKAWRSLTIPTPEPELEEELE